MTDPNQVEEHPLSEAKFASMIRDALTPHLGDQRSPGIEQQIHALLAKVNPGNGRSSTIIGPDSRPVTMNVPSAQNLALVIIQAVLVNLQTARITLVALNDMDTRLRLMNNRPSTINGADKQPDNDSGNVGDERGSQSPEAAPTTERRHLAGVNTVKEGRTG